MYDSEVGIGVFLKRHSERSEGQFDDFGICDRFGTDRLVGFRLAGEMVEEAEEGHDAVPRLDMLQAVARLSRVTGVHVKLAGLKYKFCILHRLKI